MKINKTFLIFLVTGYFTYRLIFDIPYIVQDLLFSLSYWMTLNIDLLIIVKVLSWFLPLIAITIVLYRYISKHSEIQLANGQLTLEKVSYKSIIILGVVSISIRIIRQLTQTLSIAASDKYLAQFGEESYKKWSKIYFTDGFTSVGLSLIIFGLFIYLIIWMRKN